ncbi:uncharacterized protein LOC131855994 [Cryptomeria japonica]|uniref:uncharacterized protein LOC131855994 n=1 Tax=Cryptomeria japonica TaxID=3369 RepID=UPI0027DA6831|nr:uncharacterized protein LOC131855994 [Cryptomeria japonica]
MVEAMKQPVRKATIRVLTQRRAPKETPSAPSNIGGIKKKDGIDITTESGSQPSLEAAGWNREVHKEAEKACANFWYYNNIPFNVAWSPYWESLVSSLTVVGKGFKAPSPRDLSGTLLQDAIVDAKGIVEVEKQQWQKYGCSILSDGWTDGRNRTLINSIVVSNGVMVFLKSIDASNIVKNAENLRLMLEEVVLEVGIENVVQVVTDNAMTASGHERNWSLFYAIHTKKRNKLTQKCLNDLVFVQYNLRLRTRKVQDQPDKLIDLDDIDPYSDWTVQDDDHEASLFTEDEIVDFERQAMEDLAATEAGEIGLNAFDMVEEEPLPHASMVEQ